MTCTSQPTALFESTWRIAIVIAYSIMALNLIVVRQLAELDLNHFKLRDARVYSVKGRVSASRKENSAGTRCS